jgi:alpha-L-arabinofuranosidase
MNVRFALAFPLCLAVLPTQVARAAVVPEAPVRIDAASVGAPISPYVYGQFIEHLGRCIYGGLWAEMLEDRKFFYPVTGEAPAWEMYTPGKPSWEGEGHPYELLVRSPWMVLGRAKAVAMVREGAWVGEHSPRITLPGTAGGASSRSASASRTAGSTWAASSSRPRPRRRPST